MRHTLYILIAALLVTGCSKNDPSPEPQYDPELTATCDYIRGAGVGTVGGEKGEPYYVTTLEDKLDDSGLGTAGTLRYGIEQLSNRRVILFKVAGTIYLKKQLTLMHGGITIAGQSAPGDGICIANYPLVIKSEKGYSPKDIIIRFIRFRLGDQMGTEDDALSVNDATNVVLDHCTCSWSVDECCSCYGNTNFTMQYCLISESLRCSCHGKGNHGYGGIWGGQNVTFHHNLLAHHDSRNPRFDHDYVNTLAGPIDFINNVVYNWGSNSAYGGEGTTKGGGGRKINFIANYFKPGPASSSKTRLFNPWASCDNCSNKYGGTVKPATVYLTSNVMSGSTNVTNDNWKGVTYSGGATEAQCKVTTRYTFTNCYTGEQSAEDAYQSVLSYAGVCNHRDAVDKVIISDVTNGSYTHKGSNGSTNGLIDTPADAGGYPTLDAGTKITDTDGDGIPDDWETAHGLDPTNYKDGALSTLAKGHTNLEAYLCDLVKDYYVK